MIRITKSIENPSLFFAKTSDCYELNSIKKSGRLSIIFESFVDMR